MALTPDFEVTSGDTAPAITARLTDAAGVGVDVSGTAVTFRMAPIAGGTLKVNGAAQLITPALGEVGYQWVAGDTDTPGYYLARFRVQWAMGIVESFPNDHDLLVLIKSAV